MFNLFIMKQINFKDPFSRKINYDIEIDQLECIGNLYLKGELESNESNQINNDIIRVLKTKYSS